MKDYPLPKTFDESNKKQLISKLKELDDDSLWKILEVFDACFIGDCRHHQPDKCKYRPVRKMLGLTECEVYEHWLEYKREKKKIIQT